MGGIPGSLFLPLALAIGFSMIVSYFLAQTFVPVMANWIMKGHKPAGPVLPALSAEQGEAKEKMLFGAHGKEGKLSGFDRIRRRFLSFIDRIMPYRKPIVLGYLILTAGLSVLLLQNIGKDVLPKVNGGQFQVRLRAADGTRIERTEEKTLNTINIIKDIVGPRNVAISSAYIGQHPSLFSVNPIYLWMAGPQEAVMQVALDEHYKTSLDELKEKIRTRVAQQMPDVRLSFEPIELIRYSARGRRHRWKFGSQAGSRRTTRSMPRS